MPEMEMGTALKIIGAKIAEEYREAAERKIADEEMVQNGEPSKTCTKCGKEKPLRGFHVRRASKDGLSARCKRCNCEDYRERYHSNPEFRDRRLEYADLMYCKNHQPYQYYKWLVGAKKINRDAIDRGDKPIFTCMGQIRKDITAEI